MKDNKFKMQINNYYVFSFSVEQANCFYYVSVSVNFKKMHEFCVL